MKYVKIIDNTFEPIKETRALIGKVLEVSREDHQNKTVDVWTDDEHSSRYRFSKSDVQECVLDINDEPVKHKEEYICVGDKINDREIYDWYIYNGQLLMVTGSKNDSWDYIAPEIKNHTPEYQSKETIKIGNREYNKEEVENALQDVKSID